MALTTHHTRLPAQLGPYTVVHTTETRNGLICDVKAPDGKKYLAKVPRGLEVSAGAGRMFVNTGRALQQIDSPYIAKVIDSGREQEHYYLILVSHEAQTMEAYIEMAPREAPVDRFRGMLHLWQLCAEALEQAAGRHVHHRDLHPANIMIQSNGDPLIVDFGLAELEHTLSKSPTENSYAAAFCPPELLQKQEKPDARYTDTYGLASTMLYGLIGHSNYHSQSNNAARLEALQATFRGTLPLRCLNDAQALLEQCLKIEADLRLADFNAISQAIRTLLLDLTKADDGMIVAVKFVQAANSPGFIETANSDDLFIDFQSERGDRGELRFRLATKDHFVYRAFVPQHTSNHPARHVVVTDIKALDVLTSSERKQWAWIRSNGLLVNEWMLEAIEDSGQADSSSYADIGAWADLHFRESQQEQSVLQLEKEGHDFLNKYVVLLQAEIDHLRRKAFRARFSSVKTGKHHDARFILHESVSESTVRTFLQRTQEAHLNDKELLVTILGYNTNRRNRAQSIGFAADYYPRTRELVVHDFTGTGIDLPSSGTLEENIEQEAVQYQRQLNAIRAFRYGDIVNPQLRQCLLDGSKLTAEVGLITAPIDTTVLDPTITWQDSQINALEKALYRDPITLIQGPPGTGKTTVIAAVIRQMLRHNPQARILVTSQTNLAVDNVLKKLQADKFSLLRLGAQNRIALPELAAHSFDNKLNTWAKSAAIKSRQNFEAKNYAGNLDLILQQIQKAIAEGGSWQKQQKQLLQILTFSKHRYNDLANRLGSMAEFEEALATQLEGGQQRAIALQDIQVKWQHILANAGSKQSLQAKMVAHVNVVGATCNHIASSTYRLFNFEFDCVIMDEAAKATPAEALVPINMGRKVVLIGDHKQLPPLVTTTDSIKNEVAAQLAEDDVLVEFDKIYSKDPSLFEKLFGEVPEAYREMLDTQFRMPGQLAEMISEEVYAGKLLSGPNKKENQLSALSLESCVLIDTSALAQPHSDRQKNGKSHLNRNNAQVIKGYLQHLDQFEEVANYSIGIITAYTAQATLLTDLLRNQKFERINTKSNKLEISTVDRFQGSEKDIIIFDVVRSNSQCKLGFLEMPNRINVALSRAMRMQVVVCNVNVVRNARSYMGYEPHDTPPLITRIVEQMHEQQCTVDGRQYFGHA